MKKWRLRVCLDFDFFLLMEQVPATRVDRVDEKLSISN